jgi:hypothetical protein
MISMLAGLIPVHIGLSSLIAYPTREEDVYDCGHL